MAVMQHREPNQILWVGVRPAHDGTQLTRTAGVTGLNNVPVYTTPDPEIFFLCYLMLSSRLSADGSNYAGVKAHPIGEAGLTYILFHRYDKAGQQTSVVNFNPPIELIADTEIQVISSHADIDATAVIHGWYE